MTRHPACHIPRAVSIATIAACSFLRAGAVQAQRAHYAAVEKAIPKATIVKRDLQDYALEGGDLTAYFQEGVPLKMVVSVYGEYGCATNKLYFWKGQLFFVLRTRGTYNHSAGIVDTPVEIVSEARDRFYFDQGKLMLWINRDKKIIRNGDNFTEQGEQRLRFAREMLGRARGKAGVSDTPEHRSNASPVKLLGTQYQLDSAEAATQSVPRDYVLFSQTTDKRRVPKFVLRVDTAIYPANTSYKQFLTAGAPRTPEEVYARCLQLINAPRPDFDAYLALFSPKTQTSAKDVKELRQDYPLFRTRARQLSQQKLRRRYDFGNFSQLDLDLREIAKQNAKDKSLFFVLFSFSSNTTFERIGDRVYLSNDLGAPGDASSIGQLVFKLAPLDRKIALPFSLRVPNGSAATTKLHPVDVLFDGAPLNVPLDGKTSTRFPAVNFLQHAAQVVHAGKDSGILQLWDEASAQKIRAASQEKFIQGNASQIEALLSDTSRRIAFVMDFDEGTAIFLRCPKASGDEALFEPALVFKENGVYKLSFETKSDLHSWNLNGLFQQPFSKTTCSKSPARRVQLLNPLLWPQLAGDFFAGESPPHPSRPSESGSCTRKVVPAPAFDSTST